MENRRVEFVGPQVGEELTEIRDSDPQLAETIEDEMGRRPKAGEYSAEASGHEGVGVAAYVDFTKPIDQYAALLTQRALTSYLTVVRPDYSFEDLTKLAAYINARATQVETRRRRNLSRRDSQIGKRFSKGTVREIASLSKRDFNSFLSTLENDSAHGKVNDVVSLRLDKRRLSIDEGVKLLSLLARKKINLSTAAIRKTLKYLNGKTSAKKLLDNVLSSLGLEGAVHEEDSGGVRFRGYIEGQILTTKYLGYGTTVEEASDMAARIFLEDLINNDLITRE